MGGKGSKNKKPGLATKPLTKKEIKSFAEHSGLSENDVKILHERFMSNNPDGRLDRGEFKRLYAEIRPEPTNLLDEISDFVFRAFDSDRNGYIGFGEFLIAYALTSRGDVRKKLEYAFVLYDSDGNGYLDRNEIREVLGAMLDLLGADKNNNNPQKLADECIRELDSSRDGRISKDEFVNGLMKNYSLRALMSPFN